MLRQKRREVGLDANRSHARPAAAMRDGEGLVQIDVRNVGTNIGRTGEADLGIEIGPIHIYLAAVCVNGGADVFDGFLEYAVRRGVGEHQAGKFCRVLSGLGLQIGKIDIALCIASHGNHLKATHLRRGRVGAVSRFGNQADGAVHFTAAGLITADGGEACILALCAGIRLERNGIKPGDGHELRGKFLKQLCITLRLIARGKGMHLRKFWPGHGNHFCNGIQLHGAGA